MHGRCDRRTRRDQAGENRDLADGRSPDGLLRARAKTHVSAFCGDADKAFEWLDKAVAYQDPGLSEIVTETLFDKIHSDPRWLAFLRKLGTAPDQLAKIEFKMPPLPN